MDKSTLKKLTAIVGKENILLAEQERQCYSYDGTGKEFLPEAVLLPGSTLEISQIMKLAAKVPFVVVPRGAGSGMTGGALAVQGGVVLGLARLNKIIEIDKKNQLAIVGPGVVTGDLQNEVAGVGLFYPPDPASLKFCTIGGNAAECAGGPSAVKYGVTRDYIKGLEVVLADGRVIKTGVRTDKGVVGYDLTRLFVGSEGTLGIITKLIVRLLPLPQRKQTFLVMLDSIEKAASLVADLLSHFLPCTLEYMDRTAIGIVSEKIPFSLPSGTSAMLLIELDGTKEAVLAEGLKMVEFLEESPGVLAVRPAQSQEEAQDLWIARRAVSPSAFSLKPHKMSEDVVVPRTKIPDLVAYTEKLANDLDLIIFTFGHAGDGNIHVNIMLDKAVPKAEENAAKAKMKLFEKVLELSGTLSGEHGIGITKSTALPMEIDNATLEVMKMVKSSFDPQNILNPGKIFP